ncbi:hypothetical protein M0R36_10415 [bacterium]|jgi:hypothetical protein|nr:hypothetical protein [bacterium]
MDPNIVCKGTTPMGGLPFQRNIFYDDKSEKRFINSVKSMVRHSAEYKEWKKFLIQDRGLIKCLFTNEIIDECTIEFHHHPISLQNITEAVIDKYLSEEKPFSSFDIAIDIMLLHFNMKIGIIPMVVTLHEKFHNGYLKIPVDYVIGDYKWFMENYTLREEALEVVNKYLIVKGSTHIGWDYNGDNK